MSSITKKQKELLDFLIAYIDKWGFAPTYEEMGQVFKITDASIWERLNSLAKAGRVRIEFNKARGIEIIHEK